MAIPSQQQAPQTAPQAPQSNDDAIGQLAKGFLGEIERDDDPDQRDDRDDGEVPPQEALNEDPENPEAETPSPETEDPTFEYDLDGEKVKVPEKLKGRFMADKDYRQKTMALAEERKQIQAITAMATQHAQQAQQLAPYFARLHQMDAYAQQLHEALKGPELAQSPLDYNRVQGELAILLRNRDAFANGLQQHTFQLTAKQNEIRDKQLALEAPKLFEEIPELAKPETQRKLVEYAQTAGLPPEAIDYLNYSPIGAKLLWKARQYDQMVKDQVASRAKLKEKTQGLPAATQSSRSPDRAAKDKQLHGDWKKRGGSINDPAFTQLLRSKIRS